MEEKVLSKAPKKKSLSLFKEKKELSRKIDVKLMASVASKHSWRVGEVLWLRHVTFALFKVISKVSATVFHHAMRHQKRRDRKKSKSGKWYTKNVHSVTELKSLTTLMRLRFITQRRQRGGKMKSEFKIEIYDKNDRDSVILVVRY